VVTTQTVAAVRLKASKKSAGRIRSTIMT